MNPTCPEPGCGEVLVLMRASEAIFDYVPYPDARLRRVLERDVWARVWECYGCGFWCRA